MTARIHANPNQMLEIMKKTINKGYKSAVNQTKELQLKI